MRSTLTLDRSEILIGERVVATLVLEWEGDLRVQPLNLPIEYGAIELLETDEAEDTKTESGGMQRTVLITATAFDLGTHSLGPIEVSWSKAGSVPETMEIEAVEITVKSTLEATAADLAEDDILAVKPPQELPLEWRWWHGLLLFLGLALFAALLYFLTRRRKLKQVQAEAPPLLLDPDEEALRALAEMEITGALKNEPVKVIYSRFSAILRRYLGRRHRFDALEMTSEELLDMIHEIGWQEDVFELLVMDLRQTDAVKFAKYVPDNKRRQAALNRVREIVTRTSYKATLSTETLPEAPEQDNREIRTA